MVMNIITLASISTVVGIIVGFLFCYLLFDNSELFQKIDILFDFKYKYEGKQCSFFDMEKLIDENNIEQCNTWFELGGVKIIKYTKYGIIILYYDRIRRIKLSLDHQEFWLLTKS